MFTHNRWFVIFKAVTQGTFNDKGGEAVTGFVMDNKLWDPDLGMGENLTRTPFERPGFMANNFKPDSNNGDASGVHR